MRAKKLAVALVITSTLAVAAVWLSVGESLVFDPSEYYVLSLGGAPIDIAGLRLAAQTDGFTIVDYAGDTFVASVGELPTADPLDLLLASDRLLVVDGDRFLLRVRGEPSTYTVRPSAAGLELVFSPAIVQEFDDVVAVLLDLQRFGIIGNEVDLGFSAYTKNALKGPAPPAGAMIESDLYGLTVAEDWHAFAAFKGLSVVGLRVDVVAEKLPGIALPSNVLAYVASESESLARLLLPIEQLVPLSLSGSVGLLRQAYEPVAP